MRDMNAFNVYQINIFQALKHMFKVKYNLNPRVFDNTFTEPHHRYPTRRNFRQPNQLSKPLVLSFLARGQKFGIITYMNSKKLFYL